MRKSITIKLKPIGRTDSKQMGKSTGYIVTNNVQRQREEFADEEIPNLQN